jgi:trimeric autotransporter adhesin
VLGPSAAFVIPADAQAARLARGGGSFGGLGVGSAGIGGSLAPAHAWLDVSRWLSGGAIPSVAISETGPLVAATPSASGGLPTPQDGSVPSAAAPFTALGAALSATSAETTSFSSSSSSSSVSAATAAAVAPVVASTVAPAAAEAATAAVAGSNASANNDRGGGLNHSVPGPTIRSAGLLSPDSDAPMYSSGEVHESLLGNSHKSKTFSVSGVATSDPGTPDVSGASVNSREIAPATVAAAATVAGPVLSQQQLQAIARLMPRGWRPGDPLPSNLPSLAALLQRK